MGSPPIGATDSQPVEECKQANRASAQVLSACVAKCHAPDNLAQATLQLVEFVDTKDFCDLTTEALAVLCIRPLRCELTERWDGPLIGS